MAGGGGDAGVPSSAIFFASSWSAVTSLMRWMNWAMIFMNRWRIQAKLGLFLPSSTSSTSSMNSASSENFGLQFNPWIKAKITMDSTRIFILENILELCKDCCLMLTIQLNHTLYTMIKICASSFRNYNFVNHFDILINCLRTS